MLLTESYWRWEDEDRTAPCIFSTMGYPCGKSLPAALEPALALAPSPSLGTGSEDVGEEDSCGCGLCLLAKVMPAGFHGGECCKKLFESRIWRLRLAGSSEFKAELCLHEKRLWGLCFKPATCSKILMKGWLKPQPKFQTYPSPGVGHPKGPGIQKWTV